MKTQAAWASSTTFPFANGFQLSSAHEGLVSGYSDLSGNNDLAFQDVRFFDRALSAEEVHLYAEAFPPSEPANIAAYAWWTGGGDPANLNDPANWACTNSAGYVAEGALPIASTVVVLNGNNTFAIPSGSTPVWTARGSTTRRRTRFWRCCPSTWR